MPFGYVVRDVRHGHRQAKAAAERLDQHRVVEVARVLAVDGDDGQRAEVEPSRDRRGQRRGWNAARGGGDLRRELERQVVRMDDGLGLDPRVVGRAEHVGDADLGVGRETGVADDLGDHHVAVARAALGAARDEDRQREPLLLGHEHRGRPPLTEDADDSVGTSFQDLHDAPLDAAPSLERLDPDEHAVAVHGRAHTPRRHVHVLGIGLVRRTEREAVAVDAQAAGHEVEARRQRVAVALGAHDPSRRLEGAHAFGGLGAERPVDARGAQQLRERRGLRASLEGGQQPRVERALVGMILGWRTTRRTPQPPPPTSRGRPGRRWRTASPGA